MSSDAHSVEKVGQDRSSRTLTRVRLDDPNFDAVRNAVLFNPKARCKAEAILPASYPRILSARFTGGFLDGVELEFSPNLNCLIGGRGSGKSTALLAIRAALGAKVSPEEDPDQEDRMPDETRVRFVDTAGSERTAVRRRGEEPFEPDSDSPIRLRLADLGQEESGRLARGYEDKPEVLLEFLDGFVVRHEYEERETELLAQLSDNESEVRRTSGYADKIKTLEAEHARLDASLAWPMTRMRLSVRGSRRNRWWTMPEAGMRVSTGRRPPREVAVPGSMRVLRVLRAPYARVRAVIKVGEWAGTVTFSGRLATEARNALGRY